MWIFAAFGFLTQILTVLSTDVSTQYIEHGIRFDGADIYRTGSMNDGRWDCPWKLSGTECRDGKFFCTCPTDGSSVYFRFGCCYKFPSCGVPCINTHNCKRWRNCQTCRSDVDGSWNWKACNSCKPGFVYEDGLCDKDYNECSVKNGGCDQICDNVYGSYNCRCNDGFRLKSDKHGCERLSCKAPGTISDGSVTPTDKTQPWSYESYATFSCSLTSLTLDGPYATKCNAKGLSLFWSENNPTCVDTCTYVAVEDRQQCGEHGISSDKCSQLGCCYQEDQDSTVPKCYFDPMKMFVRFGGQKPKTYTPRHSLRERNQASCAHQTKNKDGLNMYIIVHEGRNDLQGVDLQICQPVTGNRDDYELVDAEGYDIYETIHTAAGHVKGKYSEISNINIPSPHLTGIPTAVFTQYPKLRSLRTPRLVLEVWQDVSTPLDNPPCVKNCYSECDSLTKVDVGHDGRDVAVYKMHVNLRDLKKYIKPNTTRVFLYAHTVVITEDVTLPVSLYLHTLELMVERRLASFINLPEGGVSVGEVPSTGHILDAIIDRCMSLQEYDSV